MPQLRLFLIMLSLLVAFGGDLAGADPDELRQEFQERLNTHQDGQINELRRLAQWASRQNLGPESQRAWRAALALDENDRSARTALGYRRQGNDWVDSETFYQSRGYVRVHGRWLPPSQARRVEQRLEQVRSIARRHSVWENAWSIETQHFVIRSNASHEVVVESAIALEQALGEMRRIFNFNRRISRVPVDIYASQEDFMRQSARHGIPVGMGTGGYFWFRGSEMGIRSYYSGSVERTISVLVHECSHLVLNTIFPSGVPIWTDEGFAVLFEDARRTESGLDLQAIPFGRLRHLNRLIDSNQVSLENLVRAQGPAQYPVELYPQGWAFTHFLIFGGRETNQRFRIYWDSLSRRGNRSNHQLFQASFGAAPGSVQDEWIAYIKTLKPERFNDLLGAAEDAMDHFEFARSEEFIERALADSPRDWQAPAALGRLHGLRAQLAGQDKGIWQESWQAYTRALDLQGRRLRPAPRQSAYFAIHLHLDAARAALGAGEEEAALELIEQVLSQHQTIGRGYALLALLHITSDNPDNRDLKQAGELLDVADDLGRSHESIFYRALLERARGNSSRAQSLAHQAARADQWGVGRMLYPRLIEGS